MQWFYAHLGDTDNRGVVEQEELFEMARKGKLGPSDLVWNQQEDVGWVPASSVRGLFPEPSEENIPAPEKEIEVTAPPPEPAKSGKFIPILLILALLMVTAVVYTMREEADRIRKEEKATPDPEVARSNKITKLVKQIDSALTNDNPKKAASLLTELSEYDHENNHTTEFSNQIDALNADLSQINTLWQSLYAGTLTDKSAKTLIKLYDDRGGSSRVIDCGMGIMSNKTITSRLHCHLSLALLFKALEHTENAENALNQFITNADYKGKEDIYIEASRMLTAQGRTKLTTEVLQKYLENQPTNSIAWLELAAVQSEGNTLKDSMNSLKKAIIYGNNNTKRAAVQDTRFKPIKNKRSFRKLTKVK
ncbi:MAG: DUF4339 domain-containing protein [Kiritimatiellae bacterium]|nr:DUF4339 domain-containing protein [Kiritimatiellia bacterium]